MNDKHQINNLESDKNISFFKTFKCYYVALLLIFVGLGWFFFFGLVFLNLYSTL